MFQRFHAMKESREGGFTLIELLVVILIIAILAAIAIPVFLNQRQKAYKADVQSALRNGAVNAETWATGNDAAPGSYVGFDGSAEDLQWEDRASSTQTYTVPLETANEFCLEVSDTRLGADPWATARYDSRTGRPESGACPLV